MYGMGDVIAEQREEIEVLRVENAALRKKLGLDLPISTNTKVRCPNCRELGDLSSPEDFSLRNWKVDGNKFHADLTCMKCEQFHLPWEGELAAGESDEV